MPTGPDSFPPVTETDDSCPFNQGLAEAARYVLSLSMCCQGLILRRALHLLRGARRTRFLPGLLRAASGQHPAGFGLCFAQKISFGLNVP